MSIKNIKNKIIDFLFEKKKKDNSTFEDYCETEPLKKIEVLNLNEMLSQELTDEILEKNSNTEETTEESPQKEIIDKEGDEIIFEKEKQRILNASHLTPEEKEDIISELYDDFKNYESNN